MASFEVIAIFCASEWH